MSTIYNITLENQNKLDFVLTRKRMRNIIMRIKADGTIAVSAPHRTPLEEITRFIVSKTDWINATKSKLSSAVNELSYLPDSITNGQPIVLFGQAYYLQILSSEIQGVFVQEDKVCIHSRTPNDTELLEKIFTKWLSKYTRSTFEQLLNMLYPKMSAWSLPFPKLFVRQLKSSWGLCKLREQSITLNSALIHTPLSCIEYVILHELTHLKHFNHSKEFYILLAQVCPDWKVQKQLLRKYSGVLRR